MKIGIVETGEKIRMCTTCHKKPMIWCEYFMSIKKFFNYFLVFFFLDGVCNFRSLYAVKLQKVQVLSVFFLWSLFSVLYCSGKNGSVKLMDRSNNCWVFMTWSFEVEQHNIQDSKIYLFQKTRKMQYFKFYVLLISRKTVGSFGGFEWLEKAKLHVKIWFIGCFFYDERCKCKFRKNV